MRVRSGLACHARTTTIFIMIYIANTPHYILPRATQWRPKTTADTTGWVRVVVRPDQPP